MIYLLPVFLYKTKRKFTRSHYKLFCTILKSELSDLFWINGVKKIRHSKNTFSQLTSPAQMQLRPSLDYQSMTIEALE